LGLAQQKHGCQDMPYYFKHLSDQKLGFFTKPLNTPNKIKEYAQIFDYQSLSDNKKSVEDELRDVKSIQDQQEYEYYLCLLLHRYYYSKNKKKELEYAQKIIDLEKSFLGLKKNKSKKSSPNFPEFLLDKYLIDRVANWLRISGDLNSIRATLGYLHINRIYWTFYRLVVFESLLIMRNSGTLQVLDDFFNKIFFRHKKTDMEKQLQNWQPIGEVFSFFSVAFPTVRFFLNWYTILEQTFYPEGEEEKLTRSDRFGNALVEHFPQLMNDIWGGVNLVTNYSKFFKISSTLANYITVAFLFYDVLQAVRDRYLGEYQYQQKNEQYLYELSIQGNKDNEISRLIFQQKRENEINWKGADAKYSMDIAASSFLVCSFALFTFFPASILPVVAFFGCVVGTVLYLSSDAYGTFKEQSLRLEMEKLSLKPNDANLKVAQENFELASLELKKTIIENVLPGLALGLFIVSIEAALIVGAIFLVYKLFQDYKEYSPAPEEKNKNNLQEEESSSEVFYLQM
jgi:hypothetical protein